MDDADELAREIVRYAFEHDVLTQHGMAGIRKKIAGVITPADELHKLALARAEKLMNATAGTPEGAELDALATAVAAYEAARFPSP